MTAFDHKAYEQAIVRPLRGRAGRLPDDLLSRYAIELTMSDPELTNRVAEVRSHWHKSATSTAKHASYRSVYKAFLRADEDLQRQHGGALTRMSWWRTYAGNRAGSRKGEISELAQMLRTTFGELGLITSAQLEATVRASFPELAPNEVDDALAQATVRRGDPVELPKASGMGDTLYRKLSSLIADADMTSVAELLHGEFSRLHIITTFRTEPATGDLSAEAVRAAIDRENKRSGNQAAREALGLLSTQAKNGVDLRTLTLFHLLDGVRQHHKDGAPSGALLKQLLAARLDPAEARQAVVSVLSETLRAPVGGLSKVTALLEEGRLTAAQQALSTITGEDGAAARALVDRHAARVRELRDTAQVALSAGDETEAREALRQATILAVDDEALAAELLRIPPQPVLDLTAQPDGVGVRVSWRAPASHADGMRYRLVRREGRTPADATDGATVTEDTATVAADRKAPAARTIGYAVFASGDGATWSRPAGTTIEVLPPVHNVRLTDERGSVEGRWQVHPEAVAVEVRRGTAGPEVAVIGRTSFRDDPIGGADQRYSLTAVYSRADGAHVRSAPLLVRTTTHGRVQPVSALRLVAVAETGSPRVAISWRQVAETEVVVRRSAQPSPWEFGSVVPVAELSRYGEEVTGFAEDSADANGEWRTLTVAAPSGRFWYVPFTIPPGGDAVSGHGDVLGVAPPVSDLRHQRLGADLVLSWRWPESVGTAEVAWTSPTDSGRHELTRQQYQDAGGYRTRCGAGTVDVVVRTIVRADGGDCFSPSVTVTVDERPPTVTYSVEQTRRPLVGGGTVRVRLTADRPVPACTVLLVVAPGVVMPRRPDDGQVLLRSTEELRPGVPVELTAELPRLRKPYWVRCFVGDTDPVHLVDPPTRQLKVS
jgi:hypothetical protein